MSATPDGSSPAGRTVSIHPHEAELLAARIRQGQPDWLADSLATRPMVERKLAHLLPARTRGRQRAHPGGDRQGPA